MAEAALAADNTALAHAVFSAADQPGMHQKYLREECVKLTGTPPAPGTLYVVK